MLKSILSGLAGAVALTLIHESGRRVIPHAPRVDVIGTRALRRPLVAAGLRPPHYRALHRLALGLEIVSNGLFYSLVAAGNPARSWRRGVVLGLAAGTGAAFLPPFLGLGQQPHRRPPFTDLMTILWYLIGGLTAAAVAQAPLPLANWRHNGHGRLVTA